MMSCVAVGVPIIIVKSLELKIVAWSWVLAHGMSPGQLMSAFDMTP